MAVTDEEVALQAIQSFASPDDLSKKQQEAKDQIDEMQSSEDPFIDIHQLFKQYNALYFRDLLVPRVEVSWSPRLTLCAGICELVRDPNNGNKFTRIRLKLSEPLLKYRSRTDVIDTLLHEAIHAYFFVTTDWKHVRGDDGTGHGAGFLLLADAVNSHGGYGVSVFHTFHDEVDSYRTHVWQCNGVCRAWPPFFGLVKRSMNRAPAKTDSWWATHQQRCGGTFSKIAEPDPTKKKLQHLSGLQRAGRQKNKIDAWVTSSNVHGSSHSLEGNDQAESSTSFPSTGNSDNAIGSAKERKETIACPICSTDVDLDSINEHLDFDHSP